MKGEVIRDLWGTANPPLGEDHKEVEVLGMVSKGQDLVGWITTTLD